MSDDNEKFSLWFTVDDEYDADMLERIVKADLKGGKQSLKSFTVSTYYIDMKQGFNLDDFFKSKKDFFLGELNELKKAYNYNIKYINEKGKKREHYICPKKDEFGLRLGSETGCDYCRYCYMIARKKQIRGSKWAVYCCFPAVVRGEEGAHPGYDCSGAPIFDL